MKVNKLTFKSFANIIYRQEKCKFYHIYTYKKDCEPSVLSQVESLFFYGSVEKG